MKASTSTLLLSPTPYCTIGPFFPGQIADTCNDLTQFEGKTARGRQIALAGRIVEEGSKPVLNSIVEIWQPDAKGVFRHPLDPRFGEVDPGFFGWGRARTDAQGAFHFKTVLPGAYVENGSTRCPHLNLMVLAIGQTRRLVTTVFFTETPDTADDPVLNCVTDRAARRRLVAVREASLDTANVLGYRFDIVLRGENETPFFLD